MTGITPAIIFKLEYDYPEAHSKGSKGYEGYLSYIDRKEAKEKQQVSRNEKDIEMNENSIGELSERKLYHYYLDYMGDKKKQGQLFDEDADVLPDNRIKDKRKLFSLAEQKGSPLWEAVFSFDNDWLESEGLYDTKTHWLNENVMKEVVRKAVDAAIEKQGMKSPEWTASFHYNTDNIHVHIAMVELDPTHLSFVQGRDKYTGEKLYNENGEPIMQRRGAWKEDTFTNMKSIFINQIVDRTVEYKRMDELIRKNKNAIKKIDLRSLEQTRMLFIEGMKRLPDDLSQWRYGYKTINEARPYIDQIVEIYLDMYSKEDIEELESLLDEQVEMNKRLYGEESKASQYKVNKLNDLKNKMGNEVLREMKNVRQGKYKSKAALLLDTAIEKKLKKEGIVKKQMPSLYYKNQNLNEVTKQIGSALFQLNNAMRKTYHEHQKDKNLAEFDRMLEGYE